MANTTKQPFSSEERKILVEYPDSNGEFNGDTIPVPVSRVAEEVKKYGGRVSKKNLPASVRFQEGLANAYPTIGGAAGGLGTGALAIGAIGGSVLQPELSPWLLGLAARGVGATGLGYAGKQAQINTLRSLKERYQNDPYLAGLIDNPEGTPMGEAATQGASEMVGHGVIEPIMNQSGRLLMATSLGRKAMKYGTDAVDELLRRRIPVGKMLEKAPAWMKKLPVMRTLTKDGVQLAKDAWLQETAAREAAVMAAGTGERRSALQAIRAEIDRAKTANMPEATIAELENMYTELRTEPVQLPAHIRRLLGNRQLKNNTMSAEELQKTVTEWDQLYSHIPENKRTPIERARAAVANDFREQLRRLIPGNPATGELSHEQMSEGLRRALLAYKAQRMASREGPVARLLASSAGGAAVGGVAGTALGSLTGDGKLKGGALGALGGTLVMMNPELASRFALGLTNPYARAFAAQTPRIAETALSSQTSPPDLWGDNAVFTNPPVTKK